MNGIIYKCTRIIVRIILKIIFIVEKKSEKAQIIYYFQKIRKKTIAFQFSGGGKT